MTKQPEEGTIWEWRAFGRVDDDLAAKVRDHPPRLGIIDLRGEDVYLISPTSDQNVKLRRYSSGWVLKFKLLFETRPGAFALYNESAEFTYQFPVPLATLQDAARLLEVNLPDLELSPNLTDVEFVGALARSSPAVKDTKVTKRRSQYQFGGGWLELADVEFTSRSVQSISIHSPDLEVVRGILDRLKPGDQLEAMNYIEACRRWG
ncbi:MAG TPA: hypothetical protein VLM38_19075 [Blastocatellia bacterium]|nr:hypothetical protein [Blastocatellia bacterium]